MKAGVIRFPGSNCDQDIAHVLHRFFEVTVDILWYREHIEKKYELLVLPGGFSYGDYLRSGAIARFAPAMESLRAHFARGGAVLGICNGFQILCEAAFLPGILMQNNTLKHICRRVLIKANLQNPFAVSLDKQEAYALSISHRAGNYYVDDATHRALEDQGQIVFRYEGENPNGSVGAIAGLSDSSARILGMMPHPERCVDPALSGGLDGRAILQSILNAV